MHSILFEQKVLEYQKCNVDNDCYDLRQNVSYAEVFSLSLRLQQTFDHKLSDSLYIIRFAT